MWGTKESARLLEFWLGYRSVCRFPNWVNSIAIVKCTMERIAEISALPEDKKTYIFNLIYMCLRDFKTKKAYAG